MSHSLRPWAVAVGVFALMLAAGPGAQSPAKPAAKADGLLHAELSLLGRTASIVFSPTLRANDAAYKGLFAAAGQIEGRARIGQLQTNSALRLGLGDVIVGKPGAAPLSFDLFIEGTRDGWQLDIANVDAAGGASPGSLGKVALSRQPNAAGSATLAAALLPIGRDTAQLVLTWGDVKATAAVQYEEVQAPPRPGGAGRQIQPINRKHDDENVGARATMLSQMNETALVDPQGARFTVLFARTFPRGTQSQSAAGTTRRGGLIVEGPDFRRLMSTPDGAIVELSEAPALRFSNDRPVRAGKIVLRPGNQSPAFPGAYSLWLKRAGAGWRLVVNQEPDVWGSQRDSKSDVGEIDLTYSTGGEPSRPLGVALQPLAADRWRMVLSWGPHEWAADFAAAQ